jgi:glycosyltransferase involved in cell wall biosynthesis
MRKKIRIFFIDNTFTFGGAINSLNSLVKTLDKEIFEPILLSGQPVKFLDEKFINITTYHYKHKLPWIHNRIYVKISSLPFFSIRFLLKILNATRFLYWFIFVTLPEAFFYLKIGRKHNVNLIHLNNILGSQLAGIIASKLLGIPCIAHLRDFEEVHPVTRFYARLIDHHVAISEAVRENLLNLGVNDGRISVIHNGVDLAEFSDMLDYEYLFQEFGIAPSQHRYGIFGRIVDWKGIREFILAAKIIAVDFPTAKAVIVGGESDSEKIFLRDMRKLVSDLDLDSKIIFTGYRPDVPALMKFMDVVVHASTRPEPFGRVVIEGMAMKKPVVATRGGGPLEIVIDEETGFLVEMGDSGSLAHSVITLLRQPDLRLKMGLAGRERVEQCFSTQRNAGKMGEIYERLAAV